MKNAHHEENNTNKKTNEKKGLTFLHTICENDKKYNRGVFSQFFFSFS